MLLLHLTSFIGFECFLFDEPVSLIGSTEFWRRNVCRFERRNVVSLLTTTTATRFAVGGPIGARRLRRRRPDAGVAGRGPARRRRPQEDAAVAGQTPPRPRPASRRRLRRRRRRRRRRPQRRRPPQRNAQCCRCVGNGNLISP